MDADNLLMDLTSGRNAMIAMKQELERAMKGHAFDFSTQMSKESFQLNMEEYIRNHDATKQWVEEHQPNVTDDTIFIAKPCTFNEVNHLPMFIRGIDYGTIYKLKITNADGEEVYYGDIRYELNDDSGYQVIFKSVKPVTYVTVALDPQDDIDRKIHDALKDQGKLSQALLSSKMAISTRGESDPVEQTLDYIESIYFSHEELFDETGEPTALRKKFRETLKSRIFGGI